MQTLDVVNTLQFKLDEYNALNLIMVGCGGTGSHLIAGIGSIARMLRDRGVMVRITLIDPDVVAKKNIGRQLFGYADLGAGKAAQLARRIHTAYRLPFVTASKRAIMPDDQLCINGYLNVMIGCVDNGPARKVMHDHVAAAGGRLWWLDCGNELLSGQVLLGNTIDADAFTGRFGLGITDALPAPSLVMPDLLSDGDTGPTSCADLEIEGHQSLVINRLVASHANTLLFFLLVLRNLKYFGIAFDQVYGNTTPYTLTLETLADVLNIPQADLLPS